MIKTEHYFIKTYLSFCHFIYNSLYIRCEQFTRNIGIPKLQSKILINHILFHSSDGYHTILYNYAEENINEQNAR